MNKGEAAKSEAYIRAFEIPKRSPELNVCDYALWAEVNRRIRVQDAGWSDSKVKSREEYLMRLHRPAMRKPKVFLIKANRSMKRRCKKLWESKGYHFEEGGHHGV